MFNRVYDYEILMGFSCFFYFIFFWKIDRTVDSGDGGGGGLREYLFRF